MRAAIVGGGFMLAALAPCAWADAEPGEPTASALRQATALADLVVRLVPVGVVKG